MTYANKLGLDFSWHHRALCNDANRPADVQAEWFLPLEYRPPGRAVDEPTVRRAIALCNRPCPVKRQCAAMAQALRGSLGGVWAGRYVRSDGEE